MSLRIDLLDLGSARVSRVGFGVLPKQSCPQATAFLRRCGSESSRKRDAFAGTRDARAPQTTE